MIAATLTPLLPGKDPRPPTSRGERRVPDLGNELAKRWIGGLLALAAAFGVIAFAAPRRPIRMSG